jgi:hypothetical protein
MASWLECEEHGLALVLCRLQWRCHRIVLDAAIGKACGAAAALLPPARLTQTFGR